MLSKLLAISTLILLFSGCSKQPEPDNQTQEDSTQQQASNTTDNPVKAVEEKFLEAQKKVITARVTFIDLEGGFYGLVTQDGEQYLPTNLAAEYQTDGTILTFKTKAVTDVMTIQQWGTLVELYDVSAKQLAANSELQSLQLVAHNIGFKNLPV